MADKIPTPKPNAHDYVTVLAGSRLLIGTPTGKYDHKGDALHTGVEVVLTGSVVVCLADHIPQADFVVIGTDGEEF